jgi:aminopeptidase N
VLRLYVGLTYFFYKKLTLKLDTHGLGNVTTQDFVKFWGKIFAFVLLEMIGISQGFKNF